MQLMKDGIQQDWMRKFPQEAKRIQQESGITAVAMGTAAGATAAVVQPVTLPAIDANAANFLTEEMLYFWYDKQTLETSKNSKCVNVTLLVSLNIFSLKEKKLAYCQLLFLSQHSLLI